ncbi:MAG: hypothetical protein AAF840_07105 [Bacteroidota bacterium]
MYRIVSYLSCLLFIAGTFAACTIEEDNLQMMPLDQFIAQTINSEAVINLKESVTALERAAITAIISPNKVEVKTNEQLIPSLKDDVASARATLVMTLNETTKPYDATALTLIDEAVKQAVREKSSTTEQIIAVIMAKNPELVQKRKGCLDAFQGDWAGCGDPSDCWHFDGAFWVENQQCAGMVNGCQNSAVDNYDNCTGGKG